MLEPTMQPNPGLAGPDNVRRRQYSRLEVRMSAEVRTADSVFTASTRDVSEGGAGLECDRMLPDGLEVVIGLFMVLDGVEDEANPPLWVKGRVAWCAESDDGRSHMVGVRFEVITDEQKAWLRRVLAYIRERQ